MCRSLHTVMKSEMNGAAARMFALWTCMVPTETVVSFCTTTTGDTSAWAAPGRLRT